VQVNVRHQERPNNGSGRVRNTRRFAPSLLLLWACAALAEQPGRNANRNGAFVRVFPAPAGIAASEDWRLEVEGRPVFCYRDYRLNTDCPPSLFRMKVSPQAYAIFDFEGKVKVRATFRTGTLADTAPETAGMEPGPPGTGSLLPCPSLGGTRSTASEACRTTPDTASDLKNLKIRPLAFGICPRIKGSAVEFELDRPQDLTIDPDGTGLRVLHLFTNPPETDIPDKDDPNVVYFGPGVHDIGELQLESGHTLYLAGGAVLRPFAKHLRKSEKEKHYTGLEYERGIIPIRARGDDVTVRGRGIISGERGLPAGRRFGLFQGSRMKRLRIEGVVFTRSTGWTVLLHACRDSIIKRTRVLGYFTNADGFCLHSCHDCRVMDSFIHTADDCYEVKSHGSGIVFEKSQAWCDAGTSMGVCHEIDGLMTNVVWRNMTVLHYTYRVNRYEGITSRGAIFVHPAMGGTVRDIRFENITVENCSTERPLILVYNVKKPKKGIHFFPDKPFSRISGVVFEKIRADNVPKAQILIMDQSGEGMVKDIAFKDVVINGRRLVESDPRLTLKGSAGGVRVE